MRNRSNRARSIQQFSFALRSAAIFAAAILAFAVLGAGSALAQTNKVLFSFSAGTGQHPTDGLTLDAAGNLYGTVLLDNKGSGAVFELSPDGGAWHGTVLGNFPDLQKGAFPMGGLVADAAGNLYGTTMQGGNPARCNDSGCGAVFELSPLPGGGWKETVLHAFTGGDGLSPQGSLILDAAGNVYGTTYYGGDAFNCQTTGGCGVVFRLSPVSGGGWKETVLHSFTGPEGSAPNASLSLDAAGNLYGTTVAGGRCIGQAGCGVVFRLSPTTTGPWKIAVLHKFNFVTDGSAPSGSLIFDTAGNLYGTTSKGGNTSCEASGCGSIFKLSPTSSGWSLQTLHLFGGPDGAAPMTGLVFDAAGNLFGTTSLGGTGTACSTEGCGTVFKLSPTSGGSWHETVLHSFTGGADGNTPYGSVVLDPAGNFFGMTYYGGAHSGGTVFEVTP